MLDTGFRRYIQPVIEVLANCFIKLHVSANQVTALAFFVGVLAAVAVYLQYLILGVILLWISGLLDVIDGTIARLSGSTSSIGTLMDILFDRIVEIAMLISLAFLDKSLALAIVLVLSTIIITMTIFLTTGALAEKKGNKSFYYQPGLMERADGFIMISLAVLVTSYREIVLLIFAAAIFFTACQRFLEAIRILKQN